MSLHVCNLSDISTYFLGKQCVVLGMIILKIGHGYHVCGDSACLMFQCSQFALNYDDFCVHVFVNYQEFLLISWINFWQNCAFVGYQIVSSPSQTLMHA